MEGVELKDGSYVTITGNGTPTIIPVKAGYGPDKYAALAIVARALEDGVGPITAEYLEEWLSQAVHRFGQWTVAT